MPIVDYVRPVEFRAPPRPSILIPYPVLCFGSIVLMGIPMFCLDRSLWAVTALTSTILLTFMVRSLRSGDG
ncbi:MAG: hypothetical protein Q8M17_02355 [Actinomycetota bacterium]|nr:hypothetical protein [Actinomycetota bacterium]